MRAVPTVTPDTTSDSKRLYRYLSELERVVTSVINKPVTQEMPETFINMDDIRAALSASGSHPLSIEGLSGVGADAQIPGIVVASSEPPSSNYPVNTLLLLSSGGTTTFKYNKAGTPNTWTDILASAATPANMMTTDTNQTPGATVVKTWTARQVFNGGLDSAAVVNITAGGLNIDAGGATVSGDMNIEDELLISGAVVIDNTISPYTVASGVCIVAVNTSGGAVTVNLPGTVKLYRCILIKDVSGNAGTNNITISGNGHNIDGAASITLSVDYQSRLIQGTGSDWSILLGWL